LATFHIDIEREEVDRSYFQAEIKPKLNGITFEDFCKKTAQQAIDRELSAWGLDNQDAMTFSRYIKAFKTETRGEENEEMDQQN